MPITAGTTLPRVDLMASVQAAPSLQNFIAEIILPPIEVSAQSGRFGVIPAEARLRRHNTRRLPSGSYPRSTWTLTDDNFATREYGHEEALDERQARIYANYADFERERALRIAEVIRLDYEVEVAAMLQNTTTWPLSGNTGYDVSTAWSAIGADVIGDVLYGQQLGRQAGSLLLDEMVISWKTWTDISKNTALRAALNVNVDRVTLLPLGMLAPLLNLKQIHVGTAMYNSADDGQTPTFADIWSSSYASLIRRAQTSSIEEPCVGRTFHWGADGAGTPANPTIEEYVEDPVRGSVLRGRAEAQAKKLLTAGQVLLKID